jgi:hypothetical protein
MKINEYRPTTKEDFITVSFVSGNDFFSFGFIKMIREVINRMMSVAIVANLGNADDLQVI